MTNPENVITIEGTSKSESVVAHEKVLRLECLKLAITDTNCGTGAVDRAKAYSNYVIGDA